MECFRVTDIQDNNIWISLENCDMRNPTTNQVLDLLNKLNLEHCSGDQLIIFTSLEDALMLVSQDFDRNLLDIPLMLFPWDNEVLIETEIFGSSWGYLNLLGNRIF